jgi:PiT family inorganic phosphate transporter
LSLIQAARTRTLDQAPDSKSGINQPLFRNWDSLSGESLFVEDTCLIDFFFYLALGLAFGFAFISGFHDGGNVIATVISSRSMRPAKAIFIAAAAEFAGSVLLGTAVAQTMASNIIKPDFLEALSPRNVHLLIISAVGGAIIWKLITWFIGLPSSGSHALVGGLMGAGFFALGFSGLSHEKVIRSVVAPMLFSPLIGSLAGFLVFGFIRSLFANAPRSVSGFFAWLQNPTLVFLAASHGSNDSQKAMGVIALILAAGSHQSHPGSDVPQWVVIGCAAAIAAGVSTGGLRIVKTVGYGIFRLEPVHSFSSQLTSSSVILTASLLGGPVSTTQVVASSVMGVGAAGRFAGVRWPVAANIAYAWLLTLPMSSLISGCSYLMLKMAFG